MTLYMISDSIHWPESTSSEYIYTSIDKAITAIKQGIDLTNKHHPNELTILSEEYVEDDEGNNVYIITVKRHLYDDQYDEQYLHITPVSVDKTHYIF